MPNECLDQLRAWGCARLSTSYDDSRATDIKFSGKWVRVTLTE